jgi:hypothetical protein
MASKGNGRGNRRTDWTKSDEETSDDQGRVRAEMKELEGSERKSKSKSANRGVARDDETTGPDSGDESSGQAFGPPSDRKSRAKKRDHESSGTGVTPDPKRSASTFSSSYSQGGAIVERTPAQIRATRMAADDKANRSLLAEGRRPRPRGSGLGGRRHRQQHQEPQLQWTRWRPWLWQ